MSDIQNHFGYYVTSKLHQLTSNFKKVDVRHPLWILELDVRTHLVGIGCPIQAISKMDVRHFGCHILTMDVSYYKNGCHVSKMDVRYCKNGCQTFWMSHVANGCQTFWMSHFDNGCLLFQKWMSDISKMDVTHFKNRCQTFWMSHVENGCQTFWMSHSKMDVKHFKNGCPSHISKMDVRHFKNGLKWMTDIQNWRFLRVGHPKCRLVCCDLPWLWQRLPYLHKERGQILLLRAWCVLLPPCVHLLWEVCCQGEGLPDTPVEDLMPQMASCRAFLSILLWPEVFFSKCHGTWGRWIRGGALSSSLTRVCVSLRLRSSFAAAVPVPVYTTNKEPTPPAFSFSFTGIQYQ